MLRGCLLVVVAVAGVIAFAVDVSHDPCERGHVFGLSFYSGPLLLSGVAAMLVAGRTRKTSWPIIVGVATFFLVMTIHVVFLGRWLPQCSN